MSIESIITPMNFSVLRDVICQHLADERDAQIELALLNGAQESWIEENLNFLIFPKRFRYPDVEDMPCVYIYVDEIVFPQSEQDAYSNTSEVNLVAEYYAVGLNDSEGDADTNAENRLGYLTAQIYKILCSEETNLYEATGKIIKSFAVKSWKRIKTVQDENTAGTVLGARFEFTLGVEEPTYYANTSEIRDIYTKAKINNQDVDPITRYLIVNEQSS